MPLIPLIIAAIAALGGGTVVASRNAAPGDTLYGVKTATEKVRVALALNDKNKVEVKLSIAEDKLKEVEKLMKRGDSAEDVNEAVDNLKEVEDEVSDDIDKVEWDGKDTAELTAKLKANLERQQEVLKGILSKVPPQARDAIKRALENSKHGLENAIEQQQRNEDKTGEDIKDTED